MSEVGDLNLEIKNFLKSNRLGKFNPAEEKYLELLNLLFSHEAEVLFESFIGLKDKKVLDLEEREIVMAGKEFLALFKKCTDKMLGIEGYCSFQFMKNLDESHREFLLSDEMANFLKSTSRKTKFGPAQYLNVDGLDLDQLSVLISQNGVDFLNNIRVHPSEFKDISSEAMELIISPEGIKYFKQFPNERLSLFQDFTLDEIRARLSIGRISQEAGRESNKISGRFAGVEVEREAEADVPLIKSRRD
jgi:hypothetical protein